VAPGPGACARPAASLLHPDRLLPGRAAIAGPGGPTTLARLQVHCRAIAAPLSLPLTGACLVRPARRSLNLYMLDVALRPPIRRASIAALCIIVGVGACVCVWVVCRRRHIALLLLPR
jgi:hypothetical protein